MLECAPAIKKRSNELYYQSHQSAYLLLDNWETVYAQNRALGSQTHKNRLMHIGLKARIDKVKGAQARINDS